MTSSLVNSFDDHSLFTSIFKHFSFFLTFFHYPLLPNLEIGSTEGLRSGVVGLKNWVNAPTRQGLERPFLRLLSFELPV